MSSVNPHQFAGPGEVFLDHAAIFVDEFDRSGVALERLGFTLTPFRAHTSALRPGEPLKPLGTGNRCAMLRVGFIEVLGATAETPMAAQLRSQLARYPGWHLIAFSAHNAEEHHAALQSEGLDPVPIARLERSQAMPEGDNEIRASIVRLKPEAWPEGRVQIVFPAMSPDQMWHPSLVHHANGADRLSEMLVIVSEPAARAEQFARFTRRTLRAAGRRFVLELDRGRVHFAPPDALVSMVPALQAPALPYIAAVAIGCTDLDATRQLLEARNIAFRVHQRTLQLAASESLGATLIFHDRADDRVFDALDPG